MRLSTRTRLHPAVHCTVATAALCALLASAHAEDAVPTTTVRYADLTLTSPAGAATLYGRLKVAAINVCNQSAGTDAVLRIAVHACIDKAMDDAVRRINAPSLTALRFGPTDLRLARIK